MYLHLVQGSGIEAFHLWSRHLHELVSGKAGDVQGTGGLSLGESRCDISCPYGDGDIHANRSQLITQMSPGLSHILVH